MTGRSAGPSREWIAQAHRDLLPTFPNLQPASSCSARTSWRTRTAAAMTTPRTSGCSATCATAEQPDAAPFDVQVEWIRTRPHYSQRFMEWARELVARLAQLAARAGNRDLFIEWVNDVGGVQGVYGLLRIGAGRSAADSFYTERANAAAYVEGEFAAWLSRRRV